MQIFFVGVALGVNAVCMYHLLLERLKEIERLINNYFKEKEPTARRKCLIQIQRRLVKSQEYGDEKLQLVGNMIDLVSMYMYCTQIRFTLQACRVES